MLLENKVAIVTGGSSGIGEAIARLFSQEGANVVVCGRNFSNAKRVAAEFGNQGLAVKTDVSSESDVKHLIERTVQAYGKIDILVNNAAAILPKKIEDTSIEEFDHLIAVNLRSVFLTTKYAIAELRKTKGTIINMSSLNGLIGQKQNPTYAATKGGMNALTKALALDYAEDGVRVNSLCPAGVMTPLLEKWIQQQIDPEVTNLELMRMHPLGRIASSEEVAQAALFLASSLSSFVTGVALPVDGGASLGY
ncbi:MAG: SDR family oxidoreductase [Paenibacillaceae bacterium]